MTLAKAKKVSVRNWSLDRFAKAVKDRAKKVGVKTNEKKIKTCYESNITVHDTVEVLRG